jgi:hypothetical protein
MQRAGVARMVERCTEAATCFGHGCGCPLTAAIRGGKPVDLRSCSTSLNQHLSGVGHALATRRPLCRTAAPDAAAVASGHDSCMPYLPRCNPMRSDTTIVTLTPFTATVYIQKQTVIVMARC